MICPRDRGPQPYQRPALMRRQRRSPLALVLTLAWAALLSGCEHPCDVLEHRVCEAEVDEDRCELIQDPDRRALLTRSTCDGILEKMDERR